MSAMIGVLGGMGPHAGALLVERLTALNYSARRDQDHPRVLLYSNSKIPNRVDAILGLGPSPVPEIVSSLQLLARGGAGFAAMACNTAHVFLERIRDLSPLPVLDMIDTTTSAIAGSNLRRVALLSTEGTATSGIYQAMLARFGIEVITPDATLQTQVSAAIYDMRRGIKACASPLHPQTLADLDDVSTQLLERDGAQALVIACTDLSIAFRHASLCAFPLVDALDELAYACLERAQVPLDRSSAPRFPAVIE
jgi:aspartate racemase